jgi:hypothetical protein
MKMGNALGENYCGGLDVYHCLGEKTRGGQAHSAWVAAALGRHFVRGKESGDSCSAVQQKDLQ